MLTHHQLEPKDANFRDYNYIDIRLAVKEVPYDIDKSKEEQVFFCLGHRDFEDDTIFLKKIIPVENIHEDKANHFEVDNSIYEKYKDLLVGVIHTHPNHPLVPSLDDITFLPKELIGGIYEPITDHIIWWNSYRFIL